MSLVLFVAYKDLDATSEEWEAFRKNLPPTIVESDYLKFREAVASANGIAVPQEQNGFTTRELLIPVRDSNIKVRIYSPITETENGPCPLVMLFHGGGYYVGNLDTEDRAAREICVGAKAIVVDVDYRLAPEHKFPIAVNDCYDAMEWAITHAKEINADVSRIATTGTSSGGSLALAVALKDQDCGHQRVTFIATVQPATCHPKFYPEKYQNDFCSITTHADADFLTRDGIAQSEKRYLGNDETDAANPYFSPLLATKLKNLPPTYIVVGGRDPLRDDGIVLAKALEEVGVPCELDIYRGYPHGFMLFPVSVQSQHYKRWVEKISRAFHNSSIGIHYNPM